MPPYFHRYPIHICYIPESTIPYKSAKHFLVETGNGNPHLKISRFTVSSHTKTCKPPVSLPDLKQPASLLIQLHLKAEQLTILHTVKMGICILLGCHYGVRTVNSNLSSCVDSILSLPELNPPGPPLIIKVNRFTVKNHIKMGRTLIKERMISKLPLPCIQLRCKRYPATADKKIPRDVSTHSTYNTFHKKDILQILRITLFFPVMQKKQQTIPTISRIPNIKYMLTILSHICFIICMRQYESTFKMILSFYNKKGAAKYLILQHLFFCNSVIFTLTLRTAFV